MSMPPPPPPPPSPPPGGPTPGPSPSAQPYPARLTIEYPEQLNRVTTAFRIILIIPIAVLLGWAFLGERLSHSAFIGFGLITVGLLVLDGRALRLFTRRRAAG